MAKTPSPVRLDSPGGRFYQIPGESQPFPSVTHILTCIAKPALIAWSANTERAAVTEAAADLYRDWSGQLVPPQMPRESYVATLTAKLGAVKAHQKALAKAGDIGSEAHKLIEWTMRTALGADAGPKPTVSDPALWAFMAFEDWAKSVALKPVLIEQTVYSKQHRYAGTMDLLGRVKGELMLIDFKTGKGIYPESHLQNAAYQTALLEMGYVRPVGGLIVRLPKIDTDPAFETQVVPPLESLMPVFLATQTLWAWTYGHEEAYRARRKSA